MYHIGVDDDSSHLGYYDVFPGIYRAFHNVLRDYKHL